MIEIGGSRSCSRFGSGIVLIGFRSFFLGVFVIGFITYFGSYGRFWFQIEF